MQYNYMIFIYLIYAEFIITVSIIFLTYARYYLIKRKDQKNKKNIKEIRDFILTKPDISNFKKRWVSFYYLLPILEPESPHSINQSTELKKKKDEILSRHLLPLARKKAQNWYWRNRYLSAKSFALGAKPQDEPIIEELLNDKLPAIFFEATLAVAHLPTKNLINKVISEASKFNRKRFDFLLDVFHKMPDETRATVLERLAEDKDPLIKIACYRILMFYKPMPIPDQGYDDALSDYIDLATAAIRFFVYTDHKLPKELIKVLLTTRPWEIKVATLHVLVHYKATDAIDLVEATLEDSTWWVRMNAAKTLSELGEAGVQTLLRIQKENKSLAMPEINSILEDLSQDHSQGRQ